MWASYIVACHQPPRASLVGLEACLESLPNSCSSWQIPASVAVLSSTTRLADPKLTSTAFPSMARNSLYLSRAVQLVRPQSSPAAPVEPYEPSACSASVANRHFSAISRLDSNFCSSKRRLPGISAISSRNERMTSVTSRLISRHRARSFSRSCKSAAVFGSLPGAKCASYKAFDLSRKGTHSFPNIVNLILAFPCSLYCKYSL